MANPTARRAFQAMAMFCAVVHKDRRGKPTLVDAVTVINCADGLPLGAYRHHAKYIREHVAPWGALARGPQPMPPDVEQ
jgi:hypothetical protein